MKQFIINLVGSIVILIIFIRDLLFDKEIRKLNNPDSANIYDSEDL